MAVAGDQLIGRELVQQPSSSARYCLALRAIGPQFVVVARQQQRDRHVPHGVVHDGPVGDAPRFVPGRVVRASARRDTSTPCCAQVIVDREGHRALEARRRQDVARVTGVGEPLHDRAQALRHAGGRIADAVVVDEEKAHS